MKTLYNKIYDSLYSDWDKKRDSQKKSSNEVLDRILYHSNLTIKQAEEITE
ncbi:MAG: hypothetical protein M0R51_11665 [Clostridia bacterium]|jgi:hypothetical protein|nr:hypothetical protein [Clostridia bacterium]